MKREINMRSDRNQANQLIENSLKEYKKSIGEVILVSTTIELPASLTQAEREARIEIYKKLHSSKI